MLRNNLDRLRDESRDERDRRDTRSYYFTDDADYNRAPQNDLDHDEPPRTEQQRQNSRGERYGNDFSQRLPNAVRDNQPTQPRFEPDSPDRSRRENAVRVDDSAAHRRAENSGQTYQPQMQNQTTRNDEQNYTRDNARQWADDDISKQSNSHFPINSRIVETDQPNSRSGNTSNRVLPAQPEPRSQPRDNRNETAERSQNYGQSYFEQRAAITNTEQRNQSDARARDVMSRNVATVSPHDSVQHAARIMRDCDCGAIPVVDRSGRMIGMITDRDITVRLVAGGADSRAAKTADCMTTKVFACHENERLTDFVRAMSEHQIRRIVVLDDQKRVVGIISQSDLARFAQNNRSQHDDFTNLLNEISEPSRNPYR